MTTWSQWQFDWKRPQWQVVQDSLPSKNDDDAEDMGKKPSSSSDDVEGTCLCMTSALLSAEEVADYQPSDPASPTDLVGSPASWMLNVTVVASSFCSVEGDEEDSDYKSAHSGDLLVLELVKHSGRTCTKDSDNKLDKENVINRNEESTNEDQETQAVHRLLVKVLRWPGVALQQSEYQEEGDDNDSHSEVTRPRSSAGWRHILPVWLGGIPKKSRRPAERTVGIVATCLCRRQADIDKQYAALDALDTMTFLSLGMDPAETPQKFIQEQTTMDGSSRDDDLEQDFDPPIPELLLFCLCSDGTVHVYSPWKLLQLPATQQQQEDRGDIFGNAMSSFLLGDYVFEQLKSNIWPLSQPQATIKLTIPMPKRGKSKSKGNNGGNNHATNDECDSDGTGIGLWDRNVWDPTVDPFTAIYRTKDNVSTHCISAFEFVVIAGRGKRVQRRKDSTPSEGGFITLLSLRHYSEVRTLFLPFVPNQISPFVWGGMQFLFVIGRQGVAIAIRIDISVHNTVICGEAPSVLQDANEPLIPTVSSDQSLLLQVSSASRSERQQQPRKALCTVHRFQMLPILLPDTISDETEALSIAVSSIFGASSFVSPPTLALVCRSNSQQQILAQQRTLEALDFVRPPTSSLATRLFRGYRGSRHRRLLAIETSHEPRHVARVPYRVGGGTSMMEAPECSNDLWCHVEQVTGAIVERRLEPCSIAILKKFLLVYRAGVC
jgi:hypothetical protein